jgi:hypothetical protein
MKTQYDYWKEAHDQVMAEMAATMNYTVNATVANDHFKYFIRVNKMLEFDSVRKWMTQTYGMSEHIDRDTMNNPHWTFNIRLGGSIIYLQGDEELSWFKIRYGDPV